MIDDFVGGPRQNFPRRKPKTIEPPHKTSVSPVFPTHANAPETTSPEPAFQPPETIIRPGQSPTEREPVEKTLGSAAVADKLVSKKPRLNFTNWYWPHGRKVTAIIAVVVVLLVGAGSAAAYLNQPNNKSVVVLSKRGAYTPPPKFYSSLTGVQYPDDSVNQRPVTGVMIENSPDARPQSGINQAGVVFEAIAEGGITRFLTLYQDTQPDYLGPVRSARPYYVQWCMGFDCSLAHAGGSPEALQNIKTWAAKDLDQFANSGAYGRISSRYAPHNLYTSTAQLNTLETQKGFGVSAYTGFPRKDDPKKLPTPNASSIDFAISGVYYNAHFDYDAATNSYKRSQAGAPHMALNKDGSQVQITPKVVVALVMSYGVAADHHSQYNVIGSGPGLVFQDGVATAITWNKADIKAPLTLTDAAGKPIALNRGQTWLTALSAADKATYK